MTTIDDQVEHMLDTYPRPLSDDDRAFLRPQLRDFLLLMATMCIYLQDLEVLDDTQPGRRDSLH